MASNDGNVPKDKGWAWFVMVGGMVNLIFTHGMVSTYGLLLVRIEEKYDSNPALTSLVVSTLILTRGIVGAFVLYVLSDFLNLRTLIIIGSLTNSVGLMLSNFAPSVEFLIFSSGFVSGIGSAFCYGPSIIAVGQYFDKHRTLANAVVVIGDNMGQIVLPPIYMALFDAYGLSGTYMVLSAIVLQSVVCGFIVRPLSFYDPIGKSCYSANDRQNVSWKKLPMVLNYVLLAVRKKLTRGSQEEDDPEQKLVPSDDLNSTTLYTCPKDVNAPENMVEESADDTFNTFEPKRTVNGLRNGQNVTDMSPFVPHEADKVKDNGGSEFILKNKVVLLILLSRSINTAATISQYTFLPSRVKEMGISQGRAASLITVTGICQIFSKPLFGIIADTEILSKHYMIAICATTVAIVTLCVPFYTTYGMLMLFAVTVGIFSGTFSSSIAVMLAEQVGVERLPKAFAIDIIWQGFVLAFAQTFMGWLGEYAGGYAVCYLVMGGMELVAVTMLLSLPLIKKLQNRSNKEPTNK